VNETWMETGIVSSDAERLVSFYETGLGFERAGVLEFKQGTVHKLRHGRATIKIFQPADAPVPRGPVSRFSEIAGFAYAALHVKEIAEVLARAEAAGAEVVSGVASHRAGAQQAMLRDPDGNSWELLEER